MSSRRRVSSSSNGFMLVELSGYRVKTGPVDGRRVTLVAGGGRAGTLYAVYDLLHEMGCRWFGPEEFHEDIPDVDWQPAFDLTGRPDFAIRGFYVYENRGDPEFWLWMARNRLNYWSVEATDVPLLRKLGFRLACGSHDAQSLFLNPGDAYPYDHSQFDGNDEDRPADPHLVSDQYQGDANNDGTLSYFEAHPEWFALEAGKRIPGIGTWEGPISARPTPTPSRSSPRTTSGH